LIAAFVVAIGVIGVQFRQFWLFGYSKVEWNPVAASLAVVTAIITSWTMQTSFERQEEAQRPYPYPELDDYSRPGLWLLRLTNMGASAAYDIRLKWNQPLLNTEGKQVLFSQGDPEVPLLLPNKSIAVFIDGSSRFLSKYKDAEYSGVVEFKESRQSNNVFRHEFYINAEMYRIKLRYTTDEQATYAKLREIPDAIRSLRCDFEEKDEKLTDKELADECAAKGIKPPD
jgi:hypothetical protein